MADISNAEVQIKFIDMERRLAHFERMVEDLSDLAAQQADQIDAQAAQIKMLRRQILNMDAGPAGAPQDDRPPPHY